MCPPPSSQPTSMLESGRPRPSPGATPLPAQGPSFITRRRPPALLHLQQDRGQRGARIAARRCALPTSVPVGCSLPGWGVPAPPFQAPRGHTRDSDPPTRGLARWQEWQQWQWLSVGTPCAGRLLGRASPWQRSRAGWVRGELHRHPPLGGGWDSVLGTEQTTALPTDASLSLPLPPFLPL